MTKRQVSKPLVLVCDDDQALSGNWAESLKDLQTVTRQFEVASASLQDFSAAVRELERRRRSARTTADATHQTTLIDKADVLIVDYDLLGVSADSYLTGEVVAYLARCYSSCGLIIGLNQFGENSFDLTLAREAASYADFNVGVRQITLPALWGQATKGFRPWRWPQLREALLAFRRRCTTLHGCLDDTIASKFGFDELSTLPREMTEFIKVPGKNLDQITFRDFILRSGNGLRRKDQANDDALARIAAARIAKWLQDVVLPAQDVLVDAPHLVSRLPELLSADSGRVSAWDKTAGADVSKLGIRKSVLTPYQFADTSWLSRPAWFWKSLRDASTVQALRSKRALQLPDYVFCEDLSRFVPRAQAREFVAEVPSAFSRRCVVDPTRASMPQQDRQFLSQVVYQPEVRLAL